MAGVVFGKLILPLSRPRVVSSLAGEQINAPIAALIWLMITLHWNRNTVRAGELDTILKAGHAGSSPEDAGDQLARFVLRNFQIVISIIPQAASAREAGSGVGTAPEIRPAAGSMFVRKVVFPFATSRLRVWLCPSAFPANPYTVPPLYTADVISNSVGPTGVANPVPGSI